LGIIVKPIPFDVLRRSGHNGPEFLSRLLRIEKAEGEGSELEALRFALLVLISLLSIRSYSISS
jgi:hypothetical protein